jgi:quercetin dioxygenase-like cupin family protein
MIRQLLVRIGIMAALLCAAGAAQAQDVLTVAPSVFKLVMENNRIRVIEATFRPGEKVPEHSHPDHLIYMLSPGTLVIRPPGRTAYEMTFNSGEAVYLAAQTRAAENDGERTVRVLIVELKPAPATSARRADRGRRGGRGKRSRRR